MKTCKAYGLSKRPHIFGFILTYFKDEFKFNWITVGNEVVPGPYSQYLPQAISNIYNALTSEAFVSEATGVLTQLATFLTGPGPPLIMVNSYPYFAYASDPAQISLECALFNAKQPIIIDGNFQCCSLFVAQVDAFYFMQHLKKIGFSNVSITISETCWPTAGNAPYASLENARAYNWNLWNHVQETGTPRKPDLRMDRFFFDKFNENMKANGVQQKFRFFYPNMQPVYPSR